MEKAVGYVKVYSQEGYSDILPGQIKQKNEIRKYCEDNNLFLDRIVVEKVPNDKSETTLLNELIYKRNDDEKLSKVVVYKSSIISKDKRFYLYCCFSLARREIELVSVKEDFAKENKITSQDKSLVYAMAFYEKRRMGYLLQDGRKQKRLSGEYIPGTSPFGYKKVNGQYVIDASEAEIVKLIFKMRDKNKKTISAIVSFLNDNSIKTRRGSSWQLITVSNILKHKKVYQGFIYSPSSRTYIKGNHQPIL